MIIREARAAEAELIREQRAEAYREHAASISPGHWEGLKRAITSDGEVQPGVERLVAEIDGRVTGSVALYSPMTDAYEGLVDKLPYPEIRMLAVSPAHRGQGVASALISACIDRARAGGYRMIGLHTGEFMTQAKKLYRKFGFERVPEHDFQPADDGITVEAYRLDLPDLSR